MSELRVTKLERDDKGVWSAHVSQDGVTVAVDRRYGSWRATAQLAPQVDRWPVARAVPTRVAAALQAKVRPTEDRERRQREEARKAAEKAGAHTPADRVSGTPPDTYRQ